MLLRCVQGGPKLLLRTSNAAMNTDRPVTALLVDLNNFARYPSMSIGYLAAVLRRAAIATQVFAPLMIGVKGYSREPQATRIGLWAARANHLAASSPHGWLRRLRERAAARTASGIHRQEEIVLREFLARLDKVRPQVVLVSTYLTYKNICTAIAAACRQRGIPICIGGPYFTQPELLTDWANIPGVSAIIAGEVELRLPNILETLLRGGDLSVHEGVVVPSHDGRPRGRVAAPLTELDDVPFPDYADFPWDAYPNRIVPVITGRGCGWGACTFRSDVTSTAGRTFRTRSPANVIDEVAYHRSVHDVSRFVFTDLKLNSHLPMWRTIHSDIQRACPGARRIGAVHAEAVEDNGLSLADLREASRSGCVRLTTGLETGSQPLSLLMKKGTTIESIGAFLSAATEVGISTRCTMVIGHPGETADDVRASSLFLSRHHREIERVSLNRLAVIQGTSLHRSLARSPSRFPGFRITRNRPANAISEYANETFFTTAHRKAVLELLGEVHRINARPLTPAARDFEGVM